MAAHDSDQNKIDVSLNIMSDATLTAVDNLAKQLTTLHEFLSAQGQPGNPAAQAASAGTWTGGGTASYTRPGQTQAGVVHNPTPGAIQSAAEPSNPSQGAIDAAARRAELKAEYKEYEKTVRGGGIPERPLSEPAENLMASHLSDWQKWTLAGAEKKNPGLPNVTSRRDQFFSRVQGTERDPGEDRTLENESGMPSGMGAPSRGPSGVNPDAPGWAQALARDGITPESRLGMTVPRFGNFTTQDKLNMGARFLGRAAARNQQDGNERMGPFGMLSTQGVGRVAAGASYMADHSAALTAINNEYQRMHAFAAGEERGGEALGYSRNSSLGDIEVAGVGMRLGLPFASEASREGLRQELTQRRLQAAPGVSGEEAENIRQIVAGQGYGGKRGTDIAMKLYKPLQQAGINAETAGPIADQMIRQGNTSLEDTVQVMKDLQESAKGANLSLEDMNASTLEYSEAMQKLGGNMEETVRNAAALGHAGMDPRIMSEAMQSPLVSGRLTMNTGLAPGMHGAIGAGGQMTALADSIDQALGMGAAYGQMPDATHTSASGLKIVDATGEDAKIAAATAMLPDVPRSVIERHIRNPNWLKNQGDSADAIKTMRKQIAGQKASNKPGKRNPSSAAGLRGDDDDGAAGARNAKELTKEQKAAFESGGSKTDTVVTFDEVQDQMITMDPNNKGWRKKVKDLDKIKDPEKRLKEADKLLDKQNVAGEDPNQVKVGFTDYAMKFLKIEKPKPRKKEHSGGKPANGELLGPDIPSNTGNSGGTGIPGTTP